jgi:cytosine/adenosine deaminase-related metal-dependent hydrolase
VTRVLLDGGWIVTMGEDGAEHPDGWVLLADGVVEAVGSGEPPAADEIRDLGGAVVTPGLVNVHHHLCQTLTRARAQEADLLTWLRTLLPLWQTFDSESEYAAARAGIAELALSGCTTVFDHHYFFPNGGRGIVEAEVQAARELGVRIVAARGSMDLGESKGGLPPDTLVEQLDDVLADTERLAALHEPGPGATVQIAVAPCTPFTASRELFRESAALARRLSLPMHTHIAEVADEEPMCRELYGFGLIDFMEETGWLGEEVWAAHCVHLSDSDIDRFAATKTGVAHCPASNARLGCGIARIREMLDRQVKVGAGVDGTASNERGDLLLELKQALFMARARGGAAAMSAREALRIGTRGGASVLRREDIGSLEPGKCADVAVWRTSGLEFGGAEDLVANLVFSAPHRVEQLYVGGELIVDEGRLVRADEDEIASAHRVQARRFGAEARPHMQVGASS